MTEPTQFTAQQASDPATPAQALADMAALRADLRPLVAANPSAYPGLVEWLGSLGEPAVDAALAERAAREQAAAAMPASGWTPTGDAPAPQQAPVAQQQPWQGQQGQPAPQGPAGQQPMPAQPWQGQAPGQPGPGQPWQGQPWQGQQQPWQGQPGQPAPFGQPGQPYAYQAAGVPPKSNGKKIAIIVAIVLGVLTLLVVGAFLVLKAVLGNVVEQATSSGGTLFSSGETYGDDAELDALWDQCEAEDWGACDELYIGSAFGSEYEEFGSSCGGRVDGAAGSCVALDGDFTAVDPGTSVTGDVNTYGDDPELDALWDACADGDMGACDDLYFDAPFDSEYEQFGDTCGGTRDEGLGEFCD